MLKTLEWLRGVRVAVLGGNAHKCFGARYSLRYRISVKEKVLISELVNYYAEYRK